MFWHLFRLLWKKLGCSKLDKNDLDDSGFEINEVELSNEEDIIYIYMIVNLIGYTLITTMTVKY